MELPSRKRWFRGLTLEGGITWGVVGLFGVVLVFLVLPPHEVSYPFLRRECRNHLKQLALAMHSYHEAYGSFPPAYLADENGRPMHSWRVLLLPFLGLKPLYEQYRFDEPWDGPHNRLLAESSAEIFRCPADTGPEADASYFVVVGPKTIFPGAEPTTIKDILDGTVNTILLVEAANSGINWLEPRDLSYDEAVRGVNPKTGWGILGHHQGGADVAFADGSVEFLPDKTPLEQLRLLLERNDGRPGSLHKKP